MDDAGLWEDYMDRTKKLEIPRRLIGNPFGGR